MDRRKFLKLMASTPVILSLPLHAANNTLNAPASDILAVSERLTGRQGLDPIIAERIKQLLTAQDPTFPERLTTLATALNADGTANREAVINALSDENVATALAIISPWYLGYTGTPSTTKAVDDAKFVTFLSALMYEPTADNTIRPSYARAGGDYWAEPPHGVNVPAMPANIRQWGENSPQAAPTIPEPDEVWLALVDGRAKNLAEATALIKKNA
ncbi:hypothetical protein GCM10023078_17410 [Gibbsiella greigii]